MSLPSNWTLEEILTLSYYKGINSDLIRDVVERYSSLTALLTSKLPPKLTLTFKQSELFPGSKLNIDREVNKQFELCEKNGYRLITYWDDDYPKLLKEIHLPPVLLFVNGQLQASNSISISIVGKRECTRYGKKTATRFSEFFAKNNIIVTSGLAKGIDSYSHEAAVNSGGVTYAVIASGLDEIRPKSSHDLAERIVGSGGAILSEYKCGIKAQLPYFLTRNRIISGISKATIIVESAERGGGLNTAKFALDQSREVYAIPGNIDSIQSVGTNMLLKKGYAAPALSPEMVFEELNLNFEKFTKPHKEEKPKIELVADEKKLYEQITTEPLHIDEIANAAGLEITDAMVTLLEMEFKGIIRQLPGKHYVIT